MSLVANSLQGGPAPEIHVGFQAFLGISLLRLQRFNPRVQFTEQIPCNACAARRSTYGITLTPLPAPEPAAMTSKGYGQEEAPSRRVWVPGSIPGARRFGCLGRSSQDLAL